MGSNDGELTPEPEIDDAPDVVATAKDYHGRAIGLMRHMAKLSSGEGSEIVEARLTVSKAKSLPEGVLDLQGIAARDVHLEYPDIERVTLPVYEGSWPDWRAMVSGHHVRKTSVVALHPSRLSALARLGKLYGNRPILWRFGGADAPALVEVEKGFPHISGVAMVEPWLFELPDEGGTDG